MNLAWSCSRFLCLSKFFTFGLSSSILSSLRRDLALFSSCSKIRNAVLTTSLTELYFPDSTYSFVNFSKYSPNKMEVLRAMFFLSNIPKVGMFSLTVIKVHLKSPLKEQPLTFPNESVSLPPQLLLFRLKFFFGGTIIFQNLHFFGKAQLFYHFNKSLRFWIRNFKCYGFQDFKPIRKQR